MIGHAGLMDLFTFVCSMSVHYGMLYTNIINHQNHIRKFGQTLAIILHQHVSVTPVTFIRV
jgi:hypothetical protein